MTIHNLSSFSLTSVDFNLLNKGLSFAPTPQLTLKDQRQLLKQFDCYSNTIRQQFNYPIERNDKPFATEDLETSYLFRRMKFFLYTLRSTDLKHKC